ncbi:hypothetical protein [Humibacillus xanthopallidus]|uniref:hypothetical protein n=1 Tax=Humibacillus xanthopallidus TaxID=412689 RepID=UPI00384F786B
MAHPSGGRLAELTRTAVVRAAALTGRVDPATTDSAALASLLYRAGGCVPDGRLDPRWARHVVTAAERTAGSGLTGHRRSVARHWHSWTATDADPTTLVHKIYVSPTVRDVATTLGVILTHAPLLGVPAWKVGADLAGLHRPDKIVLYLASADRADRVASAFALALGGFAAQGVPFTGQVGATGIVSRGRDVAGTSWRADVCRMVADSLCATRVTLGLQASAADVADEALAQLAAHGLDVETWHPAPDEMVESRSAANLSAMSSPVTVRADRRDATSSAARAGASLETPAPRRTRAEVTCS